MSTDRTVSSLSISNVIVKVDGFNQGTGYTPRGMNTLRHGNIQSLVGSSIDLVELFNDMMQAHTIGVLPWNQVFSILAVNSVA